MKEKNYKRIILFLIVFALAAMIIAIWALFSGDKIEVIAPDRVPDAEFNAENIPDDNTEKSDVPSGGGSVGLTFSNEVSVDIESKTAALYFASPNKSSHDIVLQIVVKDKVIAQSGAIVPGNQVKELKLVEDADKMLSKGGYDGKFVLYYYDKTTGEKDSVNTEIPIKIEVK